MLDREEKERRGYTDPNTRVYFDGRERLEGKDWVKRKKELWDRAAGRCEQQIETWPDVRISLKCVVRCDHDAQDPHHIIPRSVKRDDRLPNLLALCRKCHILLDRRKPQWGEASRKRNLRLLGVA